MIWLWLSAAMMVATAITHSLVGERRLIGPLLARNLDLLTGYRANLVRFAWHFTSLLMIVSACLVAWPSTPTPLIFITGVIWLIAGVSDAILTRGKHIGWGPLSLSGAMAMIGAFV
jgi:hypothetical protein